MRNKIKVVLAVVVLIAVIALLVSTNKLKKQIEALDVASLELCLQVQEIEQLMQTRNPNMVMEELDCAE